MGQVSITLNGRTYRLRCGDGEEQRLLELSAHVRDTVERLAADFGQVGDDRLMIMAALLVTDELFEARARMAELQTADPSLYAPIDESPTVPKAEAETAARPPSARPPSPPASPTPTPELAAAPPATATIPAPVPLQPAGPAPLDQPGSSLKRALQRPQGKTSLSERLAEAREAGAASGASGERPAQAGRKTGNV